MKTKKIAIVCVLGLGFCLSSMNVFAQNGTATNNTNSYATAHIGFTCSSAAGDRGISNPHSTMTIPKTALDFVCHGSTSCKVDVYMSKNCSGPKIATVTVDDKHGSIVGIECSHTNGYHVSGSGTTASIDGGP